VGLEKGFKSRKPQKQHTTDQ